MRAIALLLLIAACGNHAFAARQLKAEADYAGTPAELAAEHPELSAVLNVISALDVLPDGEIDTGITVFAPNNDAVKALFSSLAMTMPADEAGYKDLIKKLGPIANQLVTAILYNISPEIVQLPANSGDSIVVPTASGLNFTVVNKDGKVLVQTPGNIATSPNGVEVVDTFMWNGSQFVVTNEVLMPAMVGSIDETTAEDGKAKLLAFRDSLDDDDSPAPAPAPADAEVL